MLNRLDMEIRGLTSPSGPAGYVGGLSAYISNGEKIGVISDLMVDNTGLIRFFIVDIRTSLPSCKIIIPVGWALMDDDWHCVIFKNLSVRSLGKMPVLPESVLDEESEKSLIAQFYRPEFLRILETGHEHDNSDPFQLPRQLRRVARVVKLHANGGNPKDTAKFIARINQFVPAVVDHIEPLDYDPRLDEDHHFFL